MKHYLISIILLSTFGALKVICIVLNAQILYCYSSCCDILHLYMKSEISHLQVKYDLDSSNLNVNIWKVNNVFIQLGL